MKTKMKMKTKVFGLLALSMLMVGVASYNTHAEESNAYVKFEADTNPTNPVNPENPDLPGEGGGTGSAGPLSIDYVPDLDFGEQKITGNIEKYQSTNLKPFVQVTDKRGTGDGYKVTAELSEFTDTVDGTKKLDAAKIDFINTELTTSSDNTSAMPTSTESFTLTANGGPVNILNASTDQGMGTWIQRWLSSNSSNEKVALTVNTANAYNRAYEGTLTWSLEVTP